MDDAGDAVRFALLLGPSLKNRFKSAIELFLLWIRLSSDCRFSPKALGRLSVDELGEVPGFFFLEKMNRESIPFCACRLLAAYGSSESPGGGA
jgi:hypothetical protein